LPAGFADLVNWGLFGRRTASEGKAAGHRGGNRRPQAALKCSRSLNCGECSAGRFGGLLTPSNRPPAQGFGGGRLLRERLARHGKYCAFRPARSANYGMLAILFLKRHRLPRRVHSLRRHLSFTFSGLHGARTPVRPAHWRRLIAGPGCVDCSSTPTTPSGLGGRMADRTARSETPGLLRLIHTLDLVAAPAMAVETGGQWPWGRGGSKKPGWPHGFGFFFHAPGWVRGKSARRPPPQGSAAIRRRRLLTC